MSDTKTYTGSCLCGAVSFTAKGVNGEVHACHCKSCRNWSGGSMLAMGSASVEFTGESTSPDTRLLSGRNAVSVESVAVVCFSKCRMVITT